MNSLMLLHILLFCKFFVAILTRKQSLCILLCVSRSGEIANCFLQSLQQPIYQQLTFQQLLSRSTRKLLIQIFHSFFPDVNTRRRTNVRLPQPSTRMLLVNQSMFLNCQNPIAMIVILTMIQSK